jgi:hypothetical protein
MYVDRVYIKSLIQEILDREFTGEKRKIHEYHDRFNYACPVCRDSEDVRKKRGNLYLNRLYHICFNCGSKMSLDKLCKNFHQQIDPDKKLQIVEYLDSQIHVSDYQNDISEFEIENLIDINEIISIFSDKEYSISDFKPLENGGYVQIYLASRGITGKMTNDIYQAKYWYTETRYENIICFLNRRANRVLSIQIRNLKPGKKRMFKIYNYETLYKWVNQKEEADDIDINQLILLNKLSYYFNILNIDFDSIITVFEGYLDSLFFPNSIGLIGVNTSKAFLETNSGLTIRYFFDNDFAGHKKTEEKIKNGFSCFLWNKLFDFVVTHKPESDPYKLMYRISKLKDLNDLSILVSNPYTKLNLQQFFSNDFMDLTWVPKTKNYRKKHVNA